MRIVVLLILIAGGSWYYFVGGRKMDEEQVRSAYAKYWSAFDVNDAKAACDLFDPKFSAAVRTKGPTGVVESTVSRAEACSGTSKFYELKSAMESKTGLELSVNVEYTITAIEISKDRKTATAHVDSEIRLGTENRLFLKINESQTDTLVRNLGVVRFLASDGVISLR